MNDPNLITKYAEQIDPVEREFVHLSMGIALKAKLFLKETGMTQAEFAASIGKKEREIERWFNGTNNLTLHTIAKIHVAFGKKLFDIELPSFRPIKHQQK